MQRKSDGGLQFMMHSLAHTFICTFATEGDIHYGKYYGNMFITIFISHAP